MTAEGLTRGNRYMFQKVNCHAYLKRIKDGIFFVPFPDDPSPLKPVEYYLLHIGYGENWLDIYDDDYEEGEMVTKTYYERIEKEFCGVVVETRMIHTKQYLWADTNEPEYGRSCPYIGKKPAESVKCARVYYANGKSRWVPLDDLDITGNQGNF